MQSSPATSMLVQSLIGQLPYLLSLIFGLVIAVVFLPRCRIPAAVTIVSILIQGLTLVAVLIGQFAIMSQNPENIAQSMRAMSAVWILANVIRAGCFGAIVFAVFMGRTPPEHSASTL